VARVEEWMKLLPDNKVPKLGAPGESYRENQLLHQVNYLFFLINLKCLLDFYTLFNVGA
jgi:hypothetical protein